MDRNKTRFLDRFSHMHKQTNNSHNLEKGWIMKDIRNRFSSQPTVSHTSPPTQSKSLVFHKQFCCCFVVVVVVIV